MTSGSVAPDNTVWPPWRQIAQPRRAVDGRAGVVALVAQLHLAGVHPDTQPDRGQRRSLQLEGAGHRIGGARERGHETVTLALLDRAHTVMGGDDIAHDLVEPRNRGRHLLGLGLPQPRRPSTSANSSVTVPVGKSPLTPSSLQSTSGASARGSMSLMLASMRGRRTAKHQRKRVDRSRLMAEYSPSAVAGGFLGKLHAAGEAEFGVDVGEVGLHGSR